MATITIESVGRRHYLRGNTYPLREQLRAAGAHWDADQKAWWIGDLARAEDLAAAQVGSTQPADERQDDGLKDDSPVLGRARYKGREYLLVWQGETKRGRAAKLASLDGSKVFWADHAAIEITKIYQSREWRGREQPMTFARLRRLREEYAEQKAAVDQQQIVGERGAYSAQYEADRHDRTPGRPLGTPSWLRHRGARIAVVLIGYETAVYVRGEDAEDMGHFGVENGWYGTAHYRAASTEEYEQLQTTDPRADGTCVPPGQV